MERRIYQLRKIKNPEQILEIEHIIQQSILITPNQTMFVQDRIYICADDVEMILPVIKQAIREVDWEIDMELCLGYGKLSVRNINGAPFCPIKMAKITNDSLQNEQRNKNKTIMDDSFNPYSVVFDESMPYVDDELDFLASESGHVFENDIAYFERIKDEKSFQNTVAYHWPRLTENIKNFKHNLLILFSKKEKK